MQLAAYILLGLLAIGAVIVGLAWWFLHSTDEAHHD